MDLVPVDSVAFELILPLRLVIGISLFYAGLQKVRHFAAFLAGVRAYEILPPDYASWFGRLLPAAEIGLGIVLILGVLPRLFATASILMFLTFFAAVAVNIRRGREIPCFCFGASSSNVGWHTLLRAGLFVLASLVLGALDTQRAPTWQILRGETLHDVRNLIPTASLACCGLVVVAYLEVVPLIIKSWRAPLALSARNRFSVAWTRENVREATADE